MRTVSTSSMVAGLELALAAAAPPCWCVTRYVYGRMSTHQHHTQPHPTHPSHIYIYIYMMRRCRFGFSYLLRATVVVAAVAQPAAPWALERVVCLALKLRGEDDGFGLFCCLCWVGVGVGVNVRWGGGGGGAARHPHDPSNPDTYIHIHIYVIYTHLGPLELAYVEVVRGGED